MSDAKTQLFEAIAMISLGVDPRRIDHCESERRHAMDVLRTYGSSSKPAKPGQGVLVARIVTDFSNGGLS